MRTRHLAFPIRPAAALAIAVAACSGPTKQVAPTTIVITLPSTIATTAPATTTTTTVATSAPASTDASTSAASTTTTSTVVLTPEQAVRAAWHGWIAAGEACTVDPKGCDRAALAQFMEPEPLAKKLEATEARIAKGWAFRLGSGSIDERYKVEQVTVEGRSARIRYCEYDDGIVADPAAGPNGADVIINDQAVSRRDEMMFKLGADDRWRVSAAVAHRQEEGRALWDTCVAA